MSSKLPQKPTNARDDRLKAALKANLQRRKGQARARAAKEAGDQASDEDGAVAPHEVGASAPQQKE